MTTRSDVTKASDLGDFRALLHTLPTGDAGAERAVRARQAQLTKPAGSLGLLEDLSAWLARWQHRPDPRVERVAIALYAGDHGVAARGVSAYPTAVTRQMVANFHRGGAAINQIADLIGAELSVHDMAPHQPTQDFTQASALTMEDYCHALFYGRDSVADIFAAKPTDVLCLGEMGIGNTSAATAMCCALYKEDPADWVGTGTGVDAQGLTRKTKTIEDGLAHHAGKLDDPLEILRRLGGHELAALAGAMIGAREHNTPVLLDGFTVCAVAAVLHTFDPRLLDHCQVGHCSAERGHKRLLDKLNRRPLLCLDMRLGEGTGAATAVGLLRAATACHNNMHTFAEAGVSQATDEQTQNV